MSPYRLDYIIIICKVSVDLKNLLLVQFLLPLAMAFKKDCEQFSNFDNSTKVYLTLL